MENQVQETLPVFDPIKLIKSHYIGSGFVQTITWSPIHMCIFFSLGKSKIHISSFTHNYKFFPSIETSIRRINHLKFIPSLNLMIVVSLNKTVSTLRFEVPEPDPKNEPDFQIMFEVLQEFSSQSEFVNHVDYDPKKKLLFLCTD